jgi:hypothetical protein
VSETLLRPPVNLVRIALHPDGYGERLLNRALWRARLLEQIRRQLRLSSDPLLKALLDEVALYPGAGSVVVPEEYDGPAIPMQIMTRLGRLSFLSATTVFGSPADITLLGIALELLYPADAITNAAVHHAYGNRR